MYIVDGFLFEDEATAELAKKEEEGIRFIKERTALDNPEVVLKLYKKLLEQELFVTAVGVRFLTELQNILLGSHYIAKEDIPPIKVAETKSVHTEEGLEKTEKKITKKIDKKVGGDYKRPFYVALFFSVVFGLSVVGMFLISEISGNNINIINYREEILDEYSAWEAQLQEKEEELKEWELELENRAENE